MPRQVHDFDPPARFVAGTVGQPGSRTFFLQASGPSPVGAAHRVISVALEKEQVVALAERVEELLDEVVRRTGGSAPVPALAPVETEDVAPLETPIEEEFRVGTMSLTWDGERERVLIECFEVGEDDDAVDAEAIEEVVDDRSVLRIALTGAGGRAFAKRALAVVQAGRQPCPFCGNPLDPEGHVCPRANGYKR